MWPPEVERVAALLRTLGVEGRLEELAREEASPPGPAVRAEGYDCDGRTVVALVPEDRELDPAKLAAAAGCASVRRRATPSLPYANTKVIVDRLILGEGTVWLEAGSARFVVMLSAVQLVELTKGTTADLVTDA